MKHFEFAHKDIDLAVLKKRAFNIRWAEVDEGVIPLTAADPDFKCAPEIRQALIDYINEGYFSYTPKLGYDDFKKTISKAIKQRKNEDVPYECILPIDSAARGMDIIAKTYLKEGDEAIIFDPLDFLFKTAVKNAGGTPVRYPAILDEEGYIDISKLENYITSNTKMICLCNPHNPLGSCYRKTDLEEILRLSNKYNLYIMNDEIWSDIIYSDAKFISLMSMPKDLTNKVIGVTGWSKSFGLAGLRIGAIYCQNEEDFNKLVKTSEVEVTMGGISSLSQVAGKAAMDNCYYWVDDFVAYLEENRNLVYDRVNKMPGLSCRKPMGTYVMFINIKETGLSSDEFVNFMKEKVKLALVPGSEEFFGPLSAGYIRLCFATSKEIVNEGLNRLEEGLKLLQEKKDK